MKNTLLLLTLMAGLGLAACEKTTVGNTPDTVIVPVPMAGPAGATGAAGESGEKGETGKSGDEGIQGKPGKTGDEGIQGEPGKPGGDTTIITPPPQVNMPADIVQEPSSVTPAK